VPARRVIVIGASAGGIEALVRLFRGVPSDIPASVLIALHVAPTAKSLLAQIIDHAASLQVSEAVHGEPLLPSRAYVAPPDRHLLVRDGAMCLSHGPRENHQRPAIDALFRSAARAYGPATVGVVLSGTLDDGTAGLVTIAEAGGVTVVQSPDDAQFTGMPCAAIRGARVDHVVPASEMGALLDSIVRQPQGLTARPATAAARKANRR